MSQFATSFPLTAAGSIGPSSILARELYIAPAKQTKIIDWLLLEFVFAQTG